MEVLSSRILLSPRDFERSRRFYEEVIGLRIYREFGAGGRVTGVVYFLGGGFLELSTSEAETVGDAVRLWLQIPDAAEVEAHLRHHGVTIRRPATAMPWGLVELWAEDPDGFELRFIEVPPEHPLRRRLETG